MTFILPAEWIGDASVDDRGYLLIGTPEDHVEIDLNRADGSTTGWWDDGKVEVYVRRSSKDLTVMEVHLCRHDMLAQEALDEANKDPYDPVHDA